MIAENGTSILYSTKVSEITFKSDSLCFTTEKGTKKVSPFQHIFLSEEKNYQGDPNFKMIKFGSDLWISRHRGNYAPGSEKSYAYAMAGNRQVMKLYELLLPFEKKYSTDQQTAVNEKFARDLEEFQKAADDYNKMTVKPVITEDQRKYIVQANSFNEEKNYQKALEYYKKANDLNSVSYPQAYYNMALIAGQVKDYRSAILNMKKYLMLVPEAEDARAAQDKIYEWEIKIDQ